MDLGPAARGVAAGTESSNLAGSRPTPTILPGSDGVQPTLKPERLSLATLPVDASVSSVFGTDVAGAVTLAAPEKQVVDYA